MPRVLQSIACAAAVVAIGLLASASALAAGNCQSAGNQQYVDPLSGCPQTSTASTHTSTAPQSTTQANPTSTPAASPATTPSSTTTTSSSSSTTPTSTTTSTSKKTARDPSGTLPFTGLNVEACVAVGIGLLGAGLLLRRIAKRA